MRVLSQLEPKKVFEYFEDISNIPRPSYKEEKISNYLVQFAKDHGLEYYQDELFNVIMIKEATPGYEDVEPIILQGHMDMVCEKKPDCHKNMEEEGLDLAIDGDYIYAKGTTLGGDDGIAVAYALAILDDDTLEHPRLEFVCTVSEEVGMDGAFALDVSMLKGKKLLNLDSEEEGILLTSCAGGCSSKVTLPVARENASGVKISISVAKLTGGHSGAEIDKWRANANTLMAGLLAEMDLRAGVQLISMEGGKKDNAIPRDCEATVLVDADKAEAAMEAANKFALGVNREYEVSDPEMEIIIANEGETEASAVSCADTSKVISLIQSLPNGIQRMSRDIEGLVETSLNLGILVLEENELILRYALRSSVGSAKEALMSKVENIAKASGATTEHNGQYPAWEFKKDSVLREDMIRIYEEMFGKKPVVEAIHAGLECGILAGKIPGLDAVSMGPEMHDIHTTEERLGISSTERMYRYVVEILRCK
ncbi:MAG: aminoacyl-histidine dipeptidase [Lachnospiraceae bacterium]|nr:aminoacyl-histidine dipeptidase [Lachnospiraceae bacterium]